MKEVNPHDTPRGRQFEIWKNAPNPMLTFVKRLDVTRLIKTSKKKHLKFNMLLCYCIGKAASKIKEFYLLPVGDKLMQYDSIAVNTIVANRDSEVSSCDIPFTNELEEFNQSYLHLTQKVADSCINHGLNDSMVIGTSALAKYEIDGAVGMYSGVFNNPFLIWGKYRHRWFATSLIISFQFHHTQMDGAHASKFLDGVQCEINELKI